jgi:hypothetical protein
MGTASLKQDGEHILMTLPFPEPVEILDKLRKKHRSLKIVYRSIYVHRETFGPQDMVPDGKSTFPVRLPPAIDRFLT